MELAAKVRKDYRSLAPAERQRFFYCLRMLQILPPTQPNNLRRYYVLYGGGYVVPTRPTNMHDQFISSHQTSCEHRNPIFPYYHRHLMVCVELGLNYADQVLRGGVAKLPERLRLLYDSNKKLFDDLFSEYKGILSRYKEESKLGNTIPPVALHYWDPTDYTRSMDIPSELKERSPDKLDTLDRLCYLVNEHYCWDFNFRTRWFGGGQLPRDFESVAYFRKRDTNLTDIERGILAGKITPRENIEEYFSINFRREFGIQKIISNVGAKNTDINYDELKKTDSSMIRETVEENEVNTMFGCQQNNMQWISADEKAGLPAQYRNDANTHNLTVPHYQYARALLKTDTHFMPGYVSTYNNSGENSMENVHNWCHNNMMYFMRDASYSICNLLFFVYHSWIDLTLETKARLIRNDSNPTVSYGQYKVAQNFLNEPKEPSALNKVGNNGNVNIDWKDYRVMEWLTPDFRRKYPGDTVVNPEDYQAPFACYDYILNDSQKGIRLSDQMDQFYQKNYVESQAFRYRHFEGFKNFDYNYIFEVRDYDEKGNVVNIEMKDKAAPVPKRLRVIGDSYLPEWEYTTRKVQRQTMEEHFNNKDLLKVIKQSVCGFASYPSETESTTVRVEIHLRKLFADKIISKFRGQPAGRQGEEKKKETEARLERLKTQGATICVIPIHTKGKAAAHCPNCKEFVKLTIQISDQLVQVDERLFAFLAQFFLYEVHSQYLNRQKQDVPLPPRLSDVFRLSASEHVFNKLEILEGARELSFDVTFRPLQGKQEDYKTSEIVFKGYSCDAETGQLVNVVKKKNYKLIDTAQMPKVESQDHRIYLYKKVRIEITNSPFETLDIEFDIVTFHDLIRFNVDIVEREDGEGRYLDAVVRDKDYQFKLRNYEQEEYVL